MNPTKRLSGFCTECGGSIDFRADLIGTTTTCPRCGKQTELMLAAPRQESSIPRKVVVWTVAAVVILVAGLVACLVVLKHFEKLAGERRDRTAAAPGAETAAAMAGFEVSGVSLEKGQGGNEFNVVATVVNSSGSRHSQVSVQFNVLDAGGKVVSVVRAFRPVLEAGEKWAVKLPVENSPEATSAKLASVKAKP